MIMIAKDEYTKRKDQCLKHLATIDGRIKNVSNLRLFIFVAVLVTGFFLYRVHAYSFLMVELIAGCVLFAAAVIWHNELYRRKNTIEKLIIINSAGLQRIDGKWGTFKDQGEEYLTTEHPFSWDLDIFGKHSLYQWITACHTYAGRKKMADALQNLSDCSESIIKKQEAVRECAPLLDWRQQLELQGMVGDISRNPENFLNWMENNQFFFKNSFFSLLFRFFPYLTLLSGTIFYIFNGSLVVFSILYAVQFALFGLFYTQVTKAITTFEKNGALLLTYSKLFELIEKQSFSSKYCRELRSALNNGKNTVSFVFHKISKVLSATEIRFNPLAHLIVNILWLWDLQCIIRADALKRESGRYIRDWIDVIGSFECLASLSVIHFEHPDWTFPVFNDSEMHIKGHDLGHPLLNDIHRVNNNFSIEKGGSVAIITGSNMSGKSTFLRSVGINLVLAYAGAPVCASYFSCSLMKLYSSMRVNDDLSSNISTFYAELLRIKKIVEAVRRGEKILFLLDELFRGTNSQDRHDGAVAVVWSLSNDKSLGIISTHDLEMCKLAKENEHRFVNYHFAEQYRDHQIVFDYKLKAGPSTTRNAMFLIRMIGIDISENNAV